MAFAGLRGSPQKRSWIALAAVAPAGHACLRPVLLARSGNPSPPPVYYSCRSLAFSLTSTLLFLLFPPVLIPPSPLKPLSPSPRERPFFCLLQKSRRPSKDLAPLLLLPSG